MTIVDCSVLYGCFLWDKIVLLDLCIYFPNGSLFCSFHLWPPKLKAMYIPKPLWTITIVYQVQHNLAIMNFIKITWSFGETPRSWEPFKLINTNPLAEPVWTHDYYWDPVTFICRWFQEEVLQPKWLPFEITYLKFHSYLPRANEETWSSNID